MVYTENGRFFVDPAEYAVIKGDVVFLTSTTHIPFTVQKVSRSGSMVYLRSNSGFGQRFGMATTAQLREIWRDPEYVEEENYTYDLGEL